MANPPLSLFWNDPFPIPIPSDPPPLPLVDETVVDTSDMTDHDLQEKVARISKNFTSGFADTLPDKGIKLRSALLQFSNELDRRSLARIQKGAAEAKFERFSDQLGELGPNITPTESNLQEKLEDKTGAAFAEELRLISYHHEAHGSQLQDEGNVSSVHQTKRDRKSAINNKSPTVESSNIYSSLGAKNLSRRSSKRRRASNQGTTSLDLEEVHHVVLLDDDSQPINSKPFEDTYDDRKEEKYHYPSRDDPECVELSYSDLRCLDPESFLSSPIMNFYIQQLQRSDAMAARKEEFHVFNTYFYSKLEEAMTCKDDRDSAFLKLRRWWKGVDIFRKAYIFLPIHGDMHWSLAIICIPAKEDESSLIILHLDSLGVHASNQIFSVVSSYLKAEHNYINENEPLSDPPVSARLWKYLPRRIEKERITVPQQKNDYDCGLFVLFFMKRFLEQAPKRLRKKDFSMFGKKWFDPAEASALRKTIREDVAHLLNRNRAENAVQDLHETSSPSKTAEEQYAVEDLHALPTVTGTAEEQHAVEDSHPPRSEAENIGE